VTLTAAEWFAFGFGCGVVVTWVWLLITAVFPRAGRRRRGPGPD
jgi:hypothetical protein